MRIAQFLPFEGPWGAIGPGLLEQGAGGRELALLQLALEWAEMGHEVDCFVGRSGAASETYSSESGGYARFVDWSIAGPVLREFSYHAVISWEHPSLFSDPRLLEAQARAARFAYFQVAHLVPGSVSALEKGAVEYVALSDWALRFLRMQDERVAAEPGHVMRNAVDLGRYAENGSATRRRNEMFYSSSPDRGLLHLLRAWPMVRKRIPDAKLHVCYGVESFLENVRWSHNRQGDVAAEIGELLDQPGIEYHGRTSQEELAKIQQRCRALAYPCDTLQPTETGCITAIEACAARATPVLTDCDCLAEEFSSVARVCPLPFKEERFVDELCDAVESWVHEGTEKLRAFAEDRTWRKQAQRWMPLLESRAGKS